jgi:cytochrome P450
MELPQSDKWIEVKIMDKIMRVVAIASGRVFVGPELCRNEKYLNASINYTVDVLEAVRAVSEITPCLRFFLADRLPEVKRVRRCIDEADKFLKPVVTARREAAKNTDYEKPDDMLQWIMDAQPNLGNNDSKELARIQLSISFAAIHTTTITAINAWVYWKPYYKRQANEI